MNKVINILLLSSVLCSSLLNGLGTTVLVSNPDSVAQVEAPASRFHTAWTTVSTPVVNHPYKSVGAVALASGTTYGLWSLYRHFFPAAVAAPVVEQPTVEAPASKLRTIAKYVLSTAAVLGGIYAGHKFGLYPSFEDAKSAVKYMFAATVGTAVAETTKTGIEACKKAMSTPVAPVAAQAEAVRLEAGQPVARLEAPVAPVAAPARKEDSEAITKLRNSLKRTEITKEARQLFQARLNALLAAQQ